MPKSLLDTLVSKKIINAEEAGKINTEAKKKGGLMDEILYARGISEADVAEAKSEISGIPVKHLASGRIPFDVLRDIPEESAKHYKIAPLGKNEGYLEIGILNPEDTATQEAIKFISSKNNIPVRMFIITPIEFQNIMKEYQSLSGEVTSALGEFEKEYEALGEEISIQREQPGSKFVDEAPVTKMMAVIMRHAVDGQASDIHIEPSRGKLKVRFRVDGTLYTSLLLPSHVHPAIVTRIKVMTNMKIDETRIPQDGRFHANISGKEIDFRVSTFPTALGEKVSIRILDPESGIGTLEELGILEKDKNIIEESIKRPFGLILISGPTGSGKSTTLYAILKMLNQERVNVVSLEDPIEYYIDGVNQSQIKPEIGYGFATGIRNILRQDPDIIMVGEIRDKETASMAIHAALTGHLVLSTIHTNNAVGVIPRLIDMGVDPFLITPTVNLVIAQRLVQKLCPESKKEVKLTGKIKDMVMEEINTMTGGAAEELKKKLPTKIYESQVSSTCPRGTRGRTGVFEILKMTSEIENIILTGPSDTKIREEAKRQGMTTMKQDGIMKVLNGTIGLKELLEIV